MARKEPTLKQKRFADRYLKSGNITKSSRQTYKTKNDIVAYQIGKRNLQSPTVKSYIEKVLVGSGLSDEQVSGQLRKIILASTSRRSLRKISPADGLRGIEMVFKLKDRFPTEKKHVTKQELKITLAGKTEDELATLLEASIQEAQKYQKLLRADKRGAKEA